MKKIKLKLTYDEIMAIDATVSAYEHTQFLHIRDYAQKSATALLIEWWLAKLKPKTYIRYHGEKTLAISLPVACALVSFYHTINVNDIYVNNVWREITQLIDTQIPKI